MKFGYEDYNHQLFCEINLKGAIDDDQEIKFQTQHKIMLTSYKQILNYNFLSKPANYVSTPINDPSETRYALPKILT